MTKDVFLEEYSSEDAVRKYTKGSAGDGISYLLEHEYGDIYLRTLRHHLSALVGDGIRVLEFGCGVGMNLLHCMDILERQNIPVAKAYGTDFSQRLITEACKEVDLKPPALQKRVKFVVARSECLISDMSEALCAAKPELIESFHLIIGVNTFRYCHRLGKEQECAKDIYDLLKPGGVCVMIDMNSKFPVFRSLLHDRLTKPKIERFLPSLEQYAAPFTAVGLEIVERRNFSWIPHSAGPALLNTCKTLTPVLNSIVPSFAMRSLVISRKPA